MGKKSKRAPTKGAEKSIQKKDEMASMLRSTQLVWEALRETSFDTLRDMYKDIFNLHQGMVHDNVSLPAISEFDVEQQSEAARKMMQTHLEAVLTVGPMSKSYQKVAFRELDSMGGVKIIDVRLGKKSYVYTCGFTSVGGKELLMRDIHRSMVDSHYIVRMLNGLYKRHKQGHPLDHGHTIGDETMGYIVLAPEPSEATLIKWTKTLETTRLYGISNYDILEVKPAVIKSGGNQNENAQLVTRFEIMRGLAFPNDETNEIQCVQASSSLESCAWCLQTRDGTNEDVKLMKCQRCRNVYYCSRECQRLHWKKGHKDTCQERGTTRETEEEYLNRYCSFLQHNQEDIDDETINKLKGLVLQGKSRTRGKM